MKTLKKKLFTYYLVKLTRIDLGLTYFHSWQKIRDHEVLNKKTIWEISYFYLGIPTTINFGLTYFHSKKKIKDHVVLNENTTW